ncbi:MAG: redoxin domain-containing protein [Proteobacteria bacterium]|nr:redoxin domain-containing protein [Pseudomonadota bacterium]
MQPLDLVRAPEIARPGLAWLNVPAPLSLAELKGKLVLLDFWTFCCINCMHVLPILRKVEEAFPNEVVVIGVHSPKFAAEKDFENLRAAVARYDIKHPVIHDPDMLLWRQYDVHAWPTLVFIDPHGRLIGKSSGEPEPIHLLNAVRDALENFDEEGSLQPRPLLLKEEPRPATRLLFPGKIKKLPGKEKLWAVADSGHHQIVLFDDHGKELRRFGNGERGGDDGPAEKASFNDPQGLTGDEAFIYVADTGNHALRSINRQSGEVTLLVGTGERGTLLLNHFQPARGRALASPWDLEIKDKILFFANAGTHQIGALDLEANQVRLIAGSSAENVRDGEVLNAELAQPSGLAFSPDFARLYFADSETSSIRYIAMKEGCVYTLAGTGLFDFGHVNGALDQARFQHALGLCVMDDHNLAVADSYNAALRHIDLVQKQVSGLDEGFTCADAVCLPLAEPAGIWADGPHRLLVSDTNNHRIVEVDRTVKTTKTWV